MSKKKQIENREDIIELVDSFYEKVRVNQHLGYIFEDIAKVDWQHHLPRMYNFWGSILLAEHSFSGNPMQKHIALSKNVSLGEIEFKEWLRLFSETLDELFEGDKVQEAKTRASNIARLMLYKVQS